MTRFTPALFGLAALLAFSASAQQAQPGEDRAAPSAPTTKAERQAARQQRLALGREMGEKDEGRLAERPAPAGTRRAATDDERLAARAQRRAAGTEAARSGTGHVPEAQATR